jgi:hypothetical protein
MMQAELIAGGHFARPLIHVFLVTQKGIINISSRSFLGADVETCTNMSHHHSFPLDSYGLPNQVGLSHCYI